MSRQRQRAKSEGQSGLLYLSYAFSSLPSLPLALCPSPFALKAGSYPDKLIEAGNRPKDNSANQKGGPSSQPAVNCPTNSGHCSDAHEKC
jgi:hypothetical protein